MRITIFKKIESQNLWNNKRGRGAQFIYKNDRDEWQVELRAQLMPRHAEKKKMKIEIVSYRGRLLDYGNLIGGCKGLIDCLCRSTDRYPARLGAIWDDSPAWLVLEAKQVQVAPENRCTEIEILDFIA